MSDSKKPTSKAVSLISGSDAKTAANLIKGFKASQKAGRVIAAFGLFAWEIKMTKLKWGQWGDWLLTHAPELCRKDKETGNLIPKELSAVSTYMGMTRDVLEDMGFTLEKWFEHLSISHGVGNCRDGKFLLVAPKKLTPEAAELQKQFGDRVDGKSIKQIRLQFGHVEEDEETGELKSTRTATPKSSPAKKLSAEDKIKAEDEQTLALYDAAYQAILALKDIDDAQHHRVPPKNRQVLLEASVKLNDKLRSLGKK